MGEKYIKKNEGFSLLECMLSNVLFMIVLITLLQVFTQFYSNCIRLQQEISNIEEARMVTAFLKEEIQNAPNIEISMRKSIQENPQDQTLPMYLIGLTLTESALSPEKTLVLHVERREVPFFRESMYYQGVAVTESKHYILIELKQQEEMMHITFVLSAKEPIKVKKSIYLKEKYKI